MGKGYSRADDGGVISETMKSFVSEPSRTIRDVPSHHEQIRQFADTLCQAGKTVPVPGQPRIRLPTKTTGGYVL
jgi:hypothetical protein